MVTYTTAVGSNVLDIRGLSTDAKPVESIPNGSTYYEIDGEHKVYMFDEASKRWIEQ